MMRKWQNYVDNAKSRKRNWSGLDQYHSVRSEWIIDAQTVQMTPRPMGTQRFEQSEEKKELVQLSVSNPEVW
jgi:hypothetical protein